jgi:hypothetical protein
MDAESVAVEHHAHAVDEEWHVVGHEHEDRALGLPAVAFEVGRQHLDERLADTAHPAEFQMGHRRRIGAVEPSAVDVVARDVPVVDAQEGFEQRIGRTTFSRDLLQTLDDVGHVVVSTHAIADRDRTARAST